jgi:PrtD family type I secretion system ABC transporter
MNETGRSVRELIETVGREFGRDRTTPDTAAKADPSPAAPARAASSPPIERLADVFRPVGGAFVGVLVLSIFANLLVFTSPIYSLQVYDRVLSSRNTMTLAMITLVAIGLYVTYALIDHYRSRSLGEVAVAVDAVIAGPAFEIALAMARAGHPSHRADSLRDADTIRDFVAGGALVALFDAPWTIVFIGVCFFIHLELGIFAVLAGLILLGLSIANEFVTRRALTEAARSSDGSLDRIAATLRNVEVIRALGMTGVVRRRWFADRRRTVHAAATASRRGGTVMVLIKFLRLTVQSTVLGLGAWLVLNGEIGPGTMFAVTIVLGRALAPVEAIVAQWKSVVAARNAWVRLDGRIRALRRTEDRMSFPRPVAGALTVENLFVAPPGSQKPVVRNVSLRLAPGEALAILGRSGSGKTSLVRALVGAWPAANGTVRIDGADIANHDPDEVGRWVGYLPQNVELFAGTIRENIARLGDADDERIFAAARTAHAHDLIQRLPDGYDTRIGEDGVGLSGGQRQRVGLARAAFGDPILVVLDEPNANLDGEGDAALAATLATWKARGVTVVVVTHKSDVLAVCDRIAVLDDGQLIKYGPRNEVMAETAKAAAEGRPNRRAAEAILATRSVGSVA